MIIYNPLQRIVVAVAVMDVVTIKVFIASVEMIWLYNLSTTVSVEGTR